MNNYQVIIIGTGTAGQTAAYTLQQQGLKVAIAESSERPGGICALAGCQAKKWFYEATEAMARSHHLLGKGITDQPTVSWADLVKEKNSFTSGVPKGTLSGLAKAGIDVLEGSASFIDANTLKVSDQQYQADTFIIATGAEPFSLPIDGAEHLLTSNDFLDLDALPPRFVFIGGGFISFEFAHFVARLNPAADREVTILEVAERPLGPFDEEMVEQLMLASEVEDIDIRTEVRIEAIEPAGDGFQVKLADGEIIEADLVVNGAGRQPAINGLGLDELGIDYTRRGISVDAQMRTSVANIFAIGDCAATVQLARVADYEAQLAAKTILDDQAIKEAKSGRGWQPIDHHTIPAVLFTYPQYGMVGQTEQALQAAGVEYIKSEGYDITWPTYRRIGMNHAAYKILASVDGKLLGGHFISDNASGMVNAIRLAMLNDINVDTLYHQSVMAPYPSRESDMSYMLKPLAEQVQDA